MDYDVNYKEKLETLLKEARNSSFYVIMMFAKFNKGLDEIRKALDEVSDDWFAQKYMYEEIAPSLEEMVKRVKEIRREVKL